jgi:multiple sugar transport system substrate-binding protein
VLNSEGFLNATPYNRAFAESMTIVKDFWAVPVFADMLFQMNDALHPYITTGEGDAKAILDGLATQWESTLAGS